jgi:hypothetical protein
MSQRSGGGAANSINTISTKKHLNHAIVVRLLIRVHGLLPVGVFQVTCPADAGHQGLNVVPSKSN